VDCRGGLSQLSCNRSATGLSLYRYSTPRNFRYSEPAVAKTFSVYVKQQVPRGPGFPLKFVGVDELHAADDWYREQEIRGDVRAIFTA
jgi:hypothetical protein